MRNSWGWPRRMGRRATDALFFTQKTVGKFVLCWVDWTRSPPAMAALFPGLSRATCFTRDARKLQMEHASTLP